MFNIDWRPIPNLASDISLLFLGRFLEIETAGRLLIGVCVVSTVFGVVFLHRVNFGCWGWWPLLAVIPAFHGALSAGFINYSIGIALLPSFLAISLWLRDHHPFYQIVANSTFALLLFFCHVISVGLFGLFLFGFEFWRFAKNKKRISDHIFLIRNLFFLFLPFVLPAFFYINQSLSKVLERDSPLIIGGWSIDSKIRGIMMPFIGGDYLLDFFAGFVFYCLFIFLTFMRKIIIKPQLVIGLVITTVLFIILPGQMLDAAFIADRLPIAVFLIAIASTNPCNIKSRHTIFFAMLVFVLALARSASMTMSWLESDRYYLRVNKLVESVEPGSSILIVSPMAELKDKGFRFWHNMRMTSPNWHFSLLNIPTLHSFPVIPLTRRSVFSQLHFVWADKQILSLAPSYSDLNFGDGGDSTWDPTFIFGRNGMGRMAMSGIAKRFDYILVVYADHLSPELRSDIDRRFPIYADKEIILLRVSLPAF
ncbi:MAG: hypothetical protein ACR2QH_17260 [Geminicoccaceae bacterium]